MRLIYTIALALLLPVMAFSQANYHPGYVIKANGDTIKGFINTREWSHNPESIDFKSQKSNADAVKFGLADINGFFIEPNTTYVKYTGPLSNNRNQFPRLDDNVDTTTTTASVFLKVIAGEKKVQLLQYTDAVKTRYFYKEPGAEPVELKYYYYYHNGSTSNTMTSRIYSGQLVYLLSKYAPGSMSKKNNVALSEFSDNDLIKSINLINGETGASVAAHKKGLPHSRYFAGIGLNSISTSFEGDNMFAGSSSTSYSPKVTIGADFFANPQVQQTILRAELSFSYTKPQIDRNPKVQPSDALYYTFRQSTISFTPQLLFNVYNTDVLKWHLGVGAILNYSFYSNNKIVYNSQRSGRKLYDLENVWVAYQFQTGILFNHRHEVAFSYSPRAVYTKYVSFDVGSSISGLTYRYHFK